MELSDSQAAAFDDRGYLFFPGLLSAAEAAPLRAALPEILARLAFGAHTYSEPFRRLALLPRLLNPVRRLLRDEVYLHQSRLNPKQGFGSGASWTWHQDYPPWHSIDGMPEPRCIMASVFVDDCTVAKSPLLILPGSHRRGLLDSSPHEDSVGKEYELHHIGREEFEGLAEEHGIEPLIGPAGSVCFVHCNLIHGSADNVSPWRRAIAYLIYNAVGNACTGSGRDWYHNNRDFTPLRAVSDDALLTL